MSILKLIIPDSEHQIKKEKRNKSVSMATDDYGSRSCHIFALFFHTSKAV
jgi:hypothetical protein